MIKYTTHVEACARILGAYPLLAACVRTVELESGAITGNNSTPDGGDLSNLLSLFSAVQEVNINPFTPILVTAVSSLGRSSGKTLRALKLTSVYGWTRTLSLSILADCTALEELHVDLEDTIPTASATNCVLPNLTEIHARRVPASFFSALSEARQGTLFVVAPILTTRSLPSLRRLSMSTDFRKADGFVKKHGHKLEALTAQKGLQQANLDAMPSLTSLSLAEVRILPHGSSAHISAAGGQAAGAA